MGECALYQRNLLVGLPAKLMGKLLVLKKAITSQEQLKQVFIHAEFISMDQYSIKVVYDRLAREHTREYWDTVVWNRMNLPKHRSILWLIVQEKLQTTDRLTQIGISTCDLCLLCARTKRHINIYSSNAT